MQRLIRELGRRLDRLVHRERHLRELEEEMGWHIDMRAESNRHDGMSARDADGHARRRFGNRTTLGEAGRDAWGGVAIETVWRDVHVSIRGLRRTPAFTASVVFTLALGIGATTAIFSVADNVVIRPLAYRDVDRLVVIRERIEQIAAQYPSAPANVSHFLEWQRRCIACDGLAAIRRTPVTLAADGASEQLGAVGVSPNLFDVLGARSAMGRLLRVGDDDSSAAPVVILADGFWRRRFGADPGIVGKTLVLNNTPRTIVGVLAKDFYFPKSSELGAMSNLPVATDVFVPLVLAAYQRTTPGEYDYSVIARRRIGFTASQLSTQIVAIERDISARSSGQVTLTPIIVPLQHQVVGPASRMLMLLLAASGAMLLIVCVNLAALLFARSAARRRESAVRVALGAVRGQLVVQQLIECLILAIASGAVGLAAARAGLAALIRLAPANLPRLTEIAIDGRVVAVAIVVCIVTGLAFGVLPAVWSSDVDPLEAMQSGGRTRTVGRSAGRAGALLIGTQVAVCAVLLIATGLLLESFARVLQVDRGFRADHVLTLDVSLPPARYRMPAERRAFYDDVARRIGAVPGVRSVGLTSALPLDGESQVDNLSRENDSRPEGQRPLGNIRYVTDGYFTTLGVPVVGGRAFGVGDRGGGVTMLSRRAALSLFPGENAVGKTMQPGGNDSTAVVIGVVPDLFTGSLESDAALAAYLSLWARTRRDFSIVVRTTNDPLLSTDAIRAELRRIDAGVPIGRVRTMEQIVAGTLAQRRFALVLIALFAVTSLLTASLGIYGVVAQSLGRRTTEIGIRMALGARAADIHRQIMRRELTPVVVGLLAGVSAELLLGRVVESLLFQVRANDPRIFVTVSGVLGAVVFAACYIPARRTTRHDVAAALRTD